MEAKLRIKKRGTLGGGEEVSKNGEEKRGVDLGVQRGQKIRVGVVPKTLLGKMKGSM